MEPTHPQSSNGPHKCLYKSYAKHSKPAYDSRCHMRGRDMYLLQQAASTSRFWPGEPPIRSEIMSSTFVPAAKRYHGILKQQGEGCSPEEIAFGWAQLTVALKRSSTASRP